MVIRTGSRTAVGSMLKSDSHETLNLADHVIFKVRLFRVVCLARASLGVASTLARLLRAWPVSLSHQTHVMALNLPCFGVQ